MRKAAVNLRCIIGGTDGEIRISGGCHRPRLRPTVLRGSKGARKGCQPRTRTGFQPRTIKGPPPEPSLHKQYYRAVFKPSTPFSRRIFGNKRSERHAAIESLLQLARLKIGLTYDEREKIISAMAGTGLQPTGTGLQRPTLDLVCHSGGGIDAESHMPPMHAFLEKGVGSQRTGTVRIFRGTPMSHGKRQKTGFRCAMTSSPGTKYKTPRWWGSWASTVEESFEKFVTKHSDLFVPNEAGRLRKLMHSPGSSRETTVATVHQIYGLFRDGRPMPPLFAKSSAAWKSWCERLPASGDGLPAKYILWDADMVDTLMRKHAPSEIMWLYRKPTYAIQRCDVARWMILYVYGGLYADLDTFPNRPSYQQVSLGIPKMLARSYKHGPEWEMKFIVATQGNSQLIDIMLNQVVNYKARMHMKVYRTRPCRFVYHTTGPYALRRFLYFNSISETVNSFAMNRPSRAFPVEELYWDRASSQPQDGDRKTEKAKGYEILTAFSMSFRVADGKTRVLVPTPPLGEEDVDLPQVPMSPRKRVRSKSHAHIEPSCLKRLRLHQDSKGLRLHTDCKFREQVAAGSLQLAADKSQPNAFHQLVNKACVPHHGEGSVQNGFQPVHVGFQPTNG